MILHKKQVENVELIFFIRNSFSRMITKHWCSNRQVEFLRMQRKSENIGNELYFPSNYSYLIVLEKCSNLIFWIAEIWNETILLLTYFQSFALDRFLNWITSGKELKWKRFFIYFRLALQIESSLLDCKSNLNGYSAMQRKKEKEEKS